jgi:hypothetical protein
MVGQLDRRYTRQYFLTLALHYSRNQAEIRTQNLQFRKMENFVFLDFIFCSTLAVSNHCDIIILTRIINVYLMKRTAEQMYCKCVSAYTSKEPIFRTLNDYFSSYSISYFLLDIISYFLSKRNSSAGISLLRELIFCTRGKL